MPNSNPCYAFARKGREHFDLVLTVKLLEEHSPKLYEDIDDHFIISRLPLEAVRQIHESTGKILSNE